MANKMLIDSSHKEETRVVVTRGNKIEEFDFEAADRRQLRGNIYLAKVTRVEPSLQAAFIEYGGNRHGFLAFSEIHPDYYQIPVADRQALLEADEQADREAEEREERRPRGGGGERSSSGERGGGRRRRGGSQRRNRRDGETVSASADENGNEPLEAREEGLEAGPHVDAAPDGEAEAGHEHHAAEPAGDEHPDEAAPLAGAEPHEDEHPDLPPAEAGGDAVPQVSEHEPDVASPAGPGADEEDEDEGDDDEEDEELEEHEVVEAVGGSDALEDVPERPRAHRRQYKIQEVIKRRQILLVQVVKEERGNKGAALTTYLSLAGRYSVLMPNTGKGGGISRKITSAEDRKRLKEIVEDLEVPDGMGIILRTAGASRTKPEIKRDFEYLMRLWESVRELTLESTAAALVYEEGSLIKRAIRDLYSKEIDEVVVSGDEGYREARAFMQMIMPSQAKDVIAYREPQALFAQYGVEAQLDSMFSNHVTLRSGGYLVINPTEALVSIDVNSGRATREHNIEDTALKTNMEASEEIARQLRLRDLAGLIVIDFIDMEERRNNRSVEKKLKDCLKNDRARIQIGRISPFGLLEMSRQRIRTGVLESSSIPCATCGGTGFVRAVPSVALQVLRSVEESLLRSATHNLTVRTRTEVAFYMLNAKRAHLAEIEARFGVAITIAADETLGTTTYAIDRGALTTALPRAPSAGIRVDSITPVDEPNEIEPTAELEEEDEREDSADATTPGEATDEAGGPRKRRRRRRGRGRGAREEVEAGEAGDAQASGEDGEGESHEAQSHDAVPNVADELADDRDDATTTRREPAYTDGPSAAHSPEEVERFEPRHPNALADIGAEVARPDDVATAAPQPEPEPEPVAVVLTEPDPDRPKRGGWWSKAKAAIGG